jgi:hypothetical protein
MAGLMVHESGHSFCGREVLTEVSLPQELPGQEPELPTLRQQVDWLLVQPFLPVEQQPRVLPRVLPQPEQRQARAVVCSSSASNKPAQPQRASCRLR